MFEWKKWPIQVRSFSEFPESLKKIKSCPKMLYFRGVWNEDIFNNSVAVVGSRRISRYGHDVIEKIVPDLVFNKVSIISGFMYGVDVEAHKTCLKSGGKTVAVLGGGLDYLYPSQNDGLYFDILDKGGLVISEYEADFKPTLWSFPQRNRIVSALSDLGILVIEAGIKSGSLITAKIGKEQNKRIFAVPGSIFSSTSEGTNWLIKNNLAMVANNAEDILEKPSLFKQTNLFDFDLDETEKLIINTIHNDDLSLDEISRLSNIPIDKLSIKISLLSLKEIVLENEGKFYLNRDYR